MKAIGKILVGIWLILFGLLSQELVNISFTHSWTVLAILGIAAGIFVLIDR